MKFTDNMRERWPERVEGWVEKIGGDELAMHVVGYAGNEQETSRGVIRSILKNGIAAPNRVKKIEEKIQRPVFVLPRMYRSIIRRKRMNQNLDKAYALMRKNASNKSVFFNLRGDHFGIIFHKPGFDDSSKARIQPRFFQAVVLPNSARGEEEKKWIKFLQKFGHPVYSGRGDLIWSPGETRGKKSL